ncbi:hypothetical protein HanLR1_Chr07g0250681 [Helianthus annuus]|nr:hypothetical protein HanLR1_Chr07g0250681 [Helianthus annuus]
MEAASKLGISVTISKVGTDLTAGATATVASSERTNDWQPAYTLDEEGLLLQLRTTLVQTLDASMSRSLLGGPQQTPAQNLSIPIIQECIDVITEHQKLLALMKGEWAKGLLPQSHIRADYTVQRIRGSPLFLIVPLPIHTYIYIIYIYMCIYIYIYITKEGILGIVTKTQPLYLNYVSLSNLQ